MPEPNDRLRRISPMAQRSGQVGSPKHSGPPPNRRDRHSCPKPDQPGLHQAQAAIKQERALSSGYSGTVLLTVSPRPNTEFLKFATGDGIPTEAHRRLTFKACDPLAEPWLNPAMLRM